MVFENMNRLDEEKRNRENIGNSMIEELGEDTIKISKSDIFDFEKEILVLGRCENFITISILEIDEGYEVKYNLERLIKFNIDYLSNPYELLDYIEKLFLAIKKGREYWLDENRYKVVPENTYFTEDMKSIKIKYVPINKEYIQDSKAEKNIITFLIKLKDISKDNVDKDYIDKIIEAVSNKQLDIISIINLIGELKRDAYLCGFKEYAYC